jgi:hypothetical protein
VVGMDGPGARPYHEVNAKGEIIVKID